MVVCLDLSIRIEALGEENEDGFVTRKLHALQVSQQVWAANDNHLAQSRLASLVSNLMIKKVGEVRSQAKWNEATNMAPLAGMELPYIETMSDMIDGTEAIDWVRLLTPEFAAALTSDSQCWTNFFRTRGQTRRDCLAKIRLSTCSALRMRLFGYSVVVWIKIILYKI